MREISESVELYLADGTLNPEAVGWSRRPVHRTGLRGWGRNKRWEYWCVMTPTHLVAMTVSDIDYLAVSSVYFLEYGGVEVAKGASLPFGGGARLPETLGEGPAMARGPGLVVQVADTGGRALLRASARTKQGPLTVDLEVVRPEGHEVLGVVVPWSDRRFQYTSKQNTLPATGTVTLGDRTFEFGDDAWAVLDHGRGRWPYDITWNWGAGSGRTGGHTVGLQFGGKWTEGTGSTENALCVDGRLTYLPDELEWTYDLSDRAAPWRIRSRHDDAVDLTFTPFHRRTERTSVGLLLTDARQCFGHYTGTIHPADADRLRIEGIRGWAEEVHMRW